MSHADNADIKSTAAHIPPLLWCLMYGPECQATSGSAPVDWRYLRSCVIGY
ncbi:hypothetical protein HMPREF9061_00694 [Actinomyces sp. oral taxon 181 str. F0379]|nr:hypothetical protein HMPREF9061_00694 [Actinomyces sp. oral taxon 181 str. F0379]